MHIHESDKKIVKCNNTYRPVKDPIKGGCFLPKRALDYKGEVRKQPEIARLMAISDKNILMQLRFVVPRNRPPYDDLYPECFSHSPSIEMDKWQAGENAEPTLAPMGPLSDDGGVKFVVKKTYKELEAENEELRKEVESLKAQLGQS